jgi:hypothetical protein
MPSRNVTAYALIVIGASLLLAGGALALPMVGPLSIVPDWASPLFDRVTGLYRWPGGLLALIEFVVACWPGIIVMSFGIGLRGGVPRRADVAEGDYQTEWRDYEKRHPDASARRAGGPPPSRSDLPG